MRLRSMIDKRFMKDFKIFENLCWGATEPTFTMSDATLQCWARDWKFSLLHFCSCCCMCVAEPGTAVSAAPACSWAALATTQTAFYPEETREREKSERKLGYFCDRSSWVFSVGVTPAEMWISAAAELLQQTSFAANIALPSLHMLSSVFTPWTLSARR